MTLTDQEYRNLQELERRTRGGQVVELENARQVAYWKALADRGYASLSDSAVCMVERVKGDFVRLTEAGREAVSSRAGASSPLAGSRGWSGKRCACGAHGATSAALNAMTSAERVALENAIRDCMTCHYERDKVPA